MSLAQHVTQSDGFDYEVLRSETNNAPVVNHSQTITGPFQDENKTAGWRHMNFAPVDELHETQSRTAAYKISSTKRYAQIAIGVLACWLASGIVFGFAALKPILVKEGVYHELCKANEDIPCVAQDMRMNLFFIVASITANIACVVAGTLLDRYGRRTCWILSCVSLSIGSILMAIPFNSPGFDGYLLGNIMLSLGGTLLFVPSFQLANAFPKHSGLIIALITGAFDASAAVFLLYRIIYDASGGSVSLDRFFLCYLTVPALILVSEFSIMPRHAYHTISELDAKIDKAVDNTRDRHDSDVNISDNNELIRVYSARADKRHAKLDKLEGVSGNAEQRELRVKAEESRQEASGVWGVLHGLPVHRQMLTPWYILVLLLTTLQMLRMNFFIATIRDQYRYMLGSDIASGNINRFFDAALPIGGVTSTPFIGLLLNNVSVPVIFGVLALLIMTIGILNCLPYGWAGYATVVAFVIFRPLYYSAISDYSTKVFGFASFGRIYGTIVCLAGLSSFAQLGLDALRHQVFHDNPTPINIALGTSGTVIDDDKTDDVAGASRSIAQRLPLHNFYRQTLTRHHSSLEIGHIIISPNKHLGESILQAPFSNGLTDTMIHPQSSDRVAQKLPIPRIKIEKSRRQRAKRACVACGKLKIKCSGGTPCDRCREADVDCVYGDLKRERIQSHLKELEVQIREYDSVLHRLQCRVDTQGQQLIADTLARFSGVNPAEPLGKSDLDLPTGISSPITADYIEEDVNRSKTSKATGFVGGHSETSWIRNLKQETGMDLSLLEAASSEFSATDPDSNSLISVSYFLDDHDLSIEQDVEAYDRPSPEVGGRLLRVYFSTVHPSFPVLAKGPFMKQYALYSTQPSFRPPPKWLAILNLNFAIAAKYSFAAHEPWCDDLDDPEVYFSRAEKLSAINSQPFDHPDIQQVQVEGLTSFYLMVIGHINRAWRVCGSSTRSAIAMGMYLRNESRNMPHVSKEIRYRIWWSIYTLENTLSVMTGRPTNSADRFCTTPLPVPFDEEQFQDANVCRLISDPNARQAFIKALTSGPLISSASESAGDSSSESQRLLSDLTTITPNISFYFLHFVKITLIMRRAIDLLYSPGFIGKPWLHVKAAIKDLSDEAESWLSSLPEIFQFTSVQKTRSFERQRWSLAFRFYSTVITITRPSLCRIDRKGSDSGASEEDQWAPANICLQSACRMLNLMPDKPDVLWLFRVSPWWCVLHYIMQAVAVLLIEMGFRSKNKPNGISEVSIHLKKAMRWLHSMAAESTAANRAWDVCHDLYERLTPISYQIVLGPQPSSGSMLPHNIALHPIFKTAYDEYMPTDPQNAAPSATLAFEMDAKQGNGEIPISPVYKDTIDAPGDDRAITSEDPYDRQSDDSAGLSESLNLEPVFAELREAMREKPEQSAAHENDDDSSETLTELETLTNVIAYIHELQKENQELSYELSVEKDLQSNSRKQSNGKSSIVQFSEEKEEENSHQF
ncbi:Protein FMP42 [Talaromyces islandicus]|uniref:Protein FMP42 n=1 Tax=Talaromyces islandicus TaxID=28573 RepID=A0A0U1LIM8_TALIS|nr:Protein FMP42 [Talaromyces islandicus]